MEIEQFEEAIRIDDFAVGDSFWLGDWEFEVVNYRIGGKPLYDNEVVFKWELTRNEFVQVIRDSHPEIKEPEKFFYEHQDELIDYFEKGFEALICECGINYESIIRDAFDEILEEK